MLSALGATDVRSLQVSLSERAAELAELDRADMDNTLHEVEMEDQYEQRFQFLQRLLEQTRGKKNTVQEQIQQEMEERAREESHSPRKTQQMWNRTMFQTHVVEQEAL